MLSLFSKHARIVVVLSVLLSANIAFATDKVVVCKQHSFPTTVPAGDYSGIAWLGGDKYAVVSDKSADEGFYLFTISVDSITGEITNAVAGEFVKCGTGNRDLEGIAWMPDKNMMLMTGEKDNRIKAYTISGKPLAVDIPRHQAHIKLPSNSGLESLSYNVQTKRLWTCNETSDITIVAYDDRFNIVGSYPYIMDSPLKDGSKAAFYAHGVSELCALDDGNLLVLEREFYVPQAKIGSSVVCKLYEFYPQTLTKHLLSQWKSRLNLTSRSIANYEGMCLGPRLKDGSRVVVMVADSQSQYKKVLKDWFKTICIR